jgi:ABC-type arginine transport system permease subunit
MSKLLDLWATEKTRVIILASILYLILGYLVGAGMSEHISFEFAATDWGNLWTYLWIVFWPELLGLLMIYYGGIFMLAIFAVALIIGMMQKN